MSDFSFTIDMPVRNEWSNVERIRMSLEQCLEAFLDDNGECDALAMVAGELLENAIKYGAWGQGEGQFRLRVFSDGTCVCVHVDSAIDPASEHVARLDAALRWIAAQPSKEQAYQTRLLEASIKRSASPGLGLPRIAYEGACDLRYELQGRVLRVIAERPLASRVAAQAAHAP